MIKLKTAVGIILFIIVLASAALAGPMALLKEDRLVISSAVTRNEKVKGIFYVGNPGDSPLTIMAVHTDCNCTKATFDNTVAPGAWGRVLLQVDTRGESGINMKEATIYTSDPNRYEIRVTLVYTIQER